MAIPYGWARAFCCLGTDVGLALLRSGAVEAEAVMRRSVRLTKVVALVCSVILAMGGVHDAAAGRGLRARVKAGYQALRNYRQKGREIRDLSRQIRKGVAGQGRALVALKALEKQLESLNRAGARRGPGGLFDRYHRYRAERDLGGAYQGLAQDAIQANASAKQVKKAWDGLKRIDHLRSPAGSPKGPLGRLLAWQNGRRIRGVERELVAAAELLSRGGDHRRARSYLKLSGRMTRRHGRSIDRRYRRARDRAQKRVWRALRSAKDLGDVRANLRLIQAYAQERGGHLNERQRAQIHDAYLGALATAHGIPQQRRGLFGRVRRRSRRRANKLSGADSGQLAQAMIRQASQDGVLDAQMMKGILGEVRAQTRRGERIELSGHAERKFKKLAKGEGARVLGVVAQGRRWRGFRLAQPWVTLAGATQGRKRQGQTQQTQRTQQTQQRRTSAGGAQAHFDYDNLIQTPAGQQLAGRLEWVGRVVNPQPGHEYKKGFGMLKRAKDPRYQFNVRVARRDGIYNANFGVDVKVTDREIHVKQDVYFDFPKGMSDNQKRDFIRNAQAAVATYMDGKMELAQRSGSSKLALRFHLNVLQRRPADKTQIIEVKKGTGHTNAGTLHTGDEPHVLAHEFIHRMTAGVDVYRDSRGSPDREAHRTVGFRETMMLGGMDIMGGYGSGTQARFLPSHCNNIGRIIAAFSGKNWEIRERHPPGGAYQHRPVAIPVPALN